MDEEVSLSVEEGYQSSPPSEFVVPARSGEGGNWREWAERVDARMVAAGRAFGAKLEERAVFWSGAAGRRALWRLVRDGAIAAMLLGAFHYTLLAYGYDMFAVMRRAMGGP